MNRREFLKIAGVSVLGIGGAAALTGLRMRTVEASHVLTDEKALIAKRWAMVVDMRKFRTPEDYRKITEACHKIHNVPDFGNPKDEIKWIWTETFKHAFPGQESDHLPEQIKELPFPVLCNHCENPPCVRVCPTKATFKRADGIVMMDQHRCIGCRFCMAACPYGARSFNYRDPRPFIKEQNTEYPTRTIGVVEKCTFCFERLAKGLRPACVEASNGGLLFGDLEDPNSEVRQALKASFTIRRKAELGTGPGVYYIIGGIDHA